MGYKTRRENDRGGVVTLSEKPYGQVATAEEHEPTVVELKARAEELGVELPRRARKAELAAAVEEAEAAEAETEPETETVE